MFISPISNEALAARKAARHAENLKAAHNVLQASLDLYRQLTTSGGEYREREQYRLFKLCNAMIDMIDDGDCLACRDILMDELRIDEDGNPVRSEDYDCDQFWRDSQYAIDRGMGEVA